MKEESIEKLFFQDDRDKDLFLEILINSKRDVQFLINFTKNLNYTEEENVLNYYLDKYNECLRNRFDVFSAKQKSIIETMNYYYNQSLEKIKYK